MLFFWRGPVENGCRICHEIPEKLDFLQFGISHIAELPAFLGTGSGQSSRTGHV
jgi:hypothetical protein